MSATFVLVSFFFLISLQKLFSFLRKSNIRILHFQISWSHQCLSINKKYIYLNNLGSKYSLLMKFGQFMSYYKRKNFIKTFYKSCDLKTSFRPYFVCKEWNITSIGKWNFLKQATYIRYVIPNLSKFVQISMLTSTESFLQRVLWKLKRAWS